MSTRKNKAVIAVAIILVIACLAGVALNARGLLPFGNNYVEKTTEVVSTTVEVNDNEDEKFVVDLTKLDTFPDVSREMSFDSFPVKDVERTSACRQAMQEKYGKKATGFSDAVTFPPTSPKNPDAAEAKGFIIEQTLRNPVYGDMMAQGLSELVMKGGQTMGEINPWLRDFVGKTDSAMSAKTEEGRILGNSYWGEYDKDGKKILVTDEYRLLAEGVSTLLARAVYVGYVEGVESQVHYPLNDAPTAAGRRTYRETKHQEKLGAYVFRYVLKDGRVQWEFAINAFDGRFEILSNPKKPTPGKGNGTTTTKKVVTTTQKVVVTTTVVSTKPKPTESKPTTEKTTREWSIPTITIPSTKKWTTTTTKATTTKQQTSTTFLPKPTSDGAEHQSRAQILGGLNLSSDGQGERQTTASRPAETYTTHVTTKVVTTRTTTTVVDLNQYDKVDDNRPDTTAPKATTPDSHGDVNHKGEWNMDG